MPTDDSSGSEALPLHDRIAEDLKSQPRVGVSQEMLAECYGTFTKGLATLSSRFFVNVRTKDGSLVLVCRGTPEEEVSVLIYS